ncbi:MAG TPA: zinc-binding dehydrogenase [Chthonomonadaceae bacterium]|nr:zinc-binding dehydrogenase [Chthonomonadaceae bacterium]
METEAIIFRGIKVVELETIELPARQPADALVDVELSGVSVGTEVWALTGQRPPGDTSFPCVPGYQAVGIVREAGPEASVRPGERIFFIQARLPDPYCQGNWMGTHLRTAVVNTAHDAGHAYWVRVPDGVTPEDAALSALAAVAERGLQHAGVHPGDLCVVIGQGVIGQASAQLARLRGAQALATDILPNRRDLAARYSADTVLDPRQDDLAAEVRSRRPEGADLIVEATGNKALIPLAISLVRPLGRVLLQGWYPGEVAFDFHATHLRRPTISVTCGMGREENERAMGWLAEGKLRLAPLLTHVFEPEQAPEAYAMMRDRPGDFLGVAFDWR